MTVSYQAVTADLERLDEEDLARPSRCLGWTRADVVYHMLLDAQRALVTFAAPATGMTDVDFVSYWAPFRPGAEGYDAHARFVRRAASAYRSDLVIVAQWSETAAAAAYAADRFPLFGLSPAWAHSAFGYPRDCLPGARDKRTASLNSISFAFPASTSH